MSNKPNITSSNKYPFTMTRSSLCLRQLQTYNPVKSSTKKPIALSEDRFSFLAKGSQIIPLPQTTKSSNFPTESPSNPLNILKSSTPINTVTHSKLKISHKILSAINHPNHFANDLIRPNFATNYISALTHDTPRTRCNNYTPELKSSRKLIIKFDSSASPLKPCILKSH